MDFKQVSADSEYQMRLILPVNSSNLLYKSIDWFLYEGNTSI